MCKDGKTVLLGRSGKVEVTIQDPSIKNAVLSAGIVVQFDFISFMRSDNMVKTTKHEMTEKEALEIAIEMWTWLRDNPMKAKIAWPKYYLVELFLCECACCEFYFKCPSCPLGDCGAESPYDVWSRCHGRREMLSDATYAAQEIVSKLQTRYAEVCNEGK